MLLNPDEKVKKLKNQRKTSLFWLCCVWCKNNLLDLTISFNLSKFSESEQLKMNWLANKTSLNTCTRACVCVCVGKKKLFSVDFSKVFFFSINRILFVYCTICIRCRCMISTKTLHNSGIYEQHNRNIRWIYILWTEYTNTHQHKHSKPSIAPHDTLAVHTFTFVCAHICIHDIHILYHTNICITFPMSYLMCARVENWILLRMCLHHSP